MFTHLHQRSSERVCAHDRLPSLPSEWRYERLRSVAKLHVSGVDKIATDGEQPVRLCNYTDVYKNDYIFEHSGYMRATASPTEVSRFRLKLDDVVITKDSESWNDIAVPALVKFEADDFVCAYHLAILRTRKEMLAGAYLHHALREPLIANQLHSAAGGVTRFGLTQGAIKQALVPVPPLDEQVAIVKYLGHAHARIDRAIAAKRRLIVLLEEQNQAIVNQAVTRGLDPMNRVVWPTTRLKQVSAIQTGLTLGQSYGDGPRVEYPYLRVANVQAGSLNLDVVKTVDVPVREARKRLLRRGDVLMTEGGDIDKLGRATLWTGEIETCIHQNHVFAVRPTLVLIPDFLVLLLSAPQARAYFEITAKKTTNLASTNSTTIGNFPFSLPPLSEQRNVVDHIERSVSAILRSTDVARREIDLLREFRTRLTSDVVTGQVDVREIAATLPELSDEEMLNGDVDEFGDDDELVSEAAERAEGVDD